jgi:hypothetical protein
MSATQLTKLKMALPVVLAIAGAGTLFWLVWSARLAFATISDLPEFYVPAKMIASGCGSSIYVIPELARFEQFYYLKAERSVVTLFMPPFGLPFILPLALVPPDVAPIVWKSFLAASLSVSVLALRAAFKLGFTATCWLCAVLCFSGAAYEALRIDQLSTVLLMSFSLAIWALKTDKPYLAGIALSGLIVKPQELLPFLIFLLGAKRYKPFVSLVIIGIVFLGLGYSFIGADGFAHYDALMRSTINDLTYLVSDISCTVRGQLYRYFPDQRVLMHYLSMAVLGVALLCIFLLGRRCGRHARWLELGLVGAMPLGIVSSLYCYYYDLLLLVPSVLLLMSTFEAELPPVGILGLMTGGLAFMLPFSIFVHFDWLLKGHKSNPQFFLLLLLALSCFWFVWGKTRTSTTAKTDSTGGEAAASGAEQTSNEPSDSSG